MSTQRVKSKDRKCRRCSLCWDAAHCWLLGDASDYLPGDAVAAAGESGLLWVCRHCDAWMQVMDDDDEDETDLDEAWELAVVAPPAMEER